MPVFYPAWKYGGLVPSSFKLITELVKKGVTATVYTTDALDKENRQAERGIRVNDFDVHYFKNLSNRLAWNRLFFSPELNEAVKSRLDAFDILHIFDSRFASNVVAARTARRRRLPYVITPLDPFKGYSRKKGLKLVFDVLFARPMMQNASAIIAQNFREYNSYLRMGIQHDRIRIVPNGFDGYDPEKVLPKGRFRAQFGIPRETRMILYIGRIDHVKGVDILVHSFSRLIRDQSFRDSILVIAGPDAGYLGRLKSIAHKLKLEEKVLVPGPIVGDQKLAAIVDSDVFVMPSRYEEFGIAPLEAYAYGIPVVVTSSCGVNYWMEKYFDKVVPPDVRNIETAIAAILSESAKCARPNLKSRLEILNGFFSWDLVSSSVLKTYEQLLNAKVSTDT